MAMGTRKQRQGQEDLWVATAELPRAASHPFYTNVNEILDRHRFDRRVEYLCRRYYQPTYGRPSVSPGVYFRMLLIGYYEGIDSERGIAWRVADSFSLREFLRYGLTETTPDHSTVSRTRRLLSVETHKAVFRWVVKILASEGVIDGQSVSIDATTLEANAALRSIVRRDNGMGYEEYLRQLAKEAGIENATRAQLARLDRKRRKKGANAEWVNPHDPDARITKMKDGRTHLAHKAEHAVDLGSGALVAVTVQGADEGDTATIEQTLAEAQEAVREVNQRGIEEVVLDKGYHSGEVLTDLRQSGIRSYVPEPERPGKRHWQGKEQEQRAVYANRRRLGGARNRRLQALRGELAERSMAHMYETGKMRRVHLRGRRNLLKRVLIQAAAFNLGLLLLKLTGVGKPKALQGRSDGISAVLSALWTLFLVYVSLLRKSSDDLRFNYSLNDASGYLGSLESPTAETAISATGC